MLKIRLQRVGKKHDPSYRVVLTDSRKSSKAGTYSELLGSFNPKVGAPVLKAEKIQEWIKKGAQPSDTVFNILVSAKVIEGKKKDVLHHTKIAAKRAKKNPPAPEAPKVETPKAEVTPKVEVPAEEPKVEETPVAEVKEEEVPAEEAAA